jgi:hypothetical protein
MTKKILFPIFCCFSFCVSAQTLFQKNYSAQEKYTDFDAVIHTADGGFAMVGFTEATDKLGDILVVKTDAQGETQWAKTFGTDSTDVATGIRETPNGELIVGGYTYGAENDKVYDDVLLISLKSDGSVNWAYGYGGADYDEVSDLVVLPNGNIVLSGFTSSYGKTVKAAYALVTDANGILINGQVVEQNAFNEFQSVLATTDGGALLAGHSPKFGAGGTGYDPIVSKLDKEGTLQWSRRYKIAGSQLVFGSTSLPDGGFLLTGVTPNPDATKEADVFVLKANPNGTPTWIKSYGTATYERPHSISVAKNGSYLVTGYHKTTVDPNTPKTGFTFNIDATSGKTIWAKTYGDTLNKSELTSSIALDNGVVMAGYTLIAGGTIGAGYLVRSDLNGNAAGCSEKSLIWTANTTLTSGDSLNFQTESNGIQSTILLNAHDLTSDFSVNAFCSKVAADELDATNLAFSIRPNPSVSSFYIHVEDKIPTILNSVEIFDLQGKKVFQTNHHSSETPLILELQQGIYWAKVTQQGQCGYRKLVIME